MGHRGPNALDIGDMDMQPNLTIRICPGVVSTPSPGFGPRAEHTFWRHACLKAPAGFKNHKTPPEHLELQSTSCFFRVIMFKLI
jgi:hypothetical protein